MSQKLLTCALAITVLLIGAAAGQVNAGGPCAPPMCGPNYCLPQMCPPPMMMAAPPPCGPPMCPPPPCPPPRCKPNPLAQICNGAVSLVTGVIALPFKVADCLIDSLACRPKCGPRPVCGPPRIACAPPISVPPYIMGPPPGMPAYGMGHHRPMGFGHGSPRRYSPMAQKEKTARMDFMAEAGNGFFGTYW
ncbi:MAG: hypothetical protein RDU20_02975 [Desulfomonilaceae bacterium]|nr:hypothetical protein [Desulfomonilaceae bacterium]